MTADDLERRVAAVRDFNRFWTAQIGVLATSILHSPYSLTEARVLFELAQREVTEVAELRRRLQLDAGYLSRILGQFKADKLVLLQSSEGDGRRLRARLTSRGRRAFATIDSRSAAETRALLSRLPEEAQRKVVGAMSTIRGLVDATPPPNASYVLRPPAPGELGWVVQRHAAVYAEEYGWDDGFEALVARIVADYVDKRDPKRSAAFIAELAGEPVGCVFCVEARATVAQLRLLFVEPKARGRGIGARLVEECIRFARRAGYQRMMLWTNDVLHAARRIYERAGFELVTQEKHHSFGHDLVGQDWRLSLA
jgi:GNAT superfamily N-acetyltransferase/DNA-binding MarR family transcriptional regulator